MAGLLLVPVLGHGVAGAASPSPSQWPTANGAEPGLQGTPNTIRFSGPDRYQTNVALNLGLRGNGGFPFDTSDPTSSNAAGLSHATGWWGAATCPRAIIVVAGDNFADALAAASLSDPTDRSAQPRLQRVAASDPLFDPVGGFDRPDTASAPIVVTTSARSGATSLASTARLTANDLVHGGCTSAREAIIVGGADAVPVGAESELISLGYREVFRVAGADRYETAARTATALGTSATPAGASCLDGDSADGRTQMGWYGNSVAEYRFDPHSCQLLSRSVVLADGGAGADALAAGWWTSYWQVPVLLTNPDGTLPAATRTALSTMDIDTVIVLGGVRRIPERTVDQARALATALVGRIAGADRTATSVEMAKAFGGWRATGSGADFDNDIACFATSTGSQGWPDALAAGPLCGRLTASGATSPTRALPPVTGADAATGMTGGMPRSHDAVPVILLPSGQRTLPAAVSDLLGSAFSADAGWCSVDSAKAGCLGSGFGVLVGGEAGVPADVADALTDLLAGGHASSVGDRAPDLNRPFVTNLNLSPIYAQFGDGGPLLCVPRNGASDVRWVSFTTDVSRRTFLSEFDLLRSGRYDGSTGQSRATCVGEAWSGPSFAVAGVSISGRTTQPVVFDTDPSRHLSVSKVIRQSGSRLPGTSSRHWVLSGAPVDLVDIRHGSSAQRITEATLDLQLSVEPSGRRATVNGSFVLETALGSLGGTVRGDATLTGSVWEVRGATEVGPFPNGNTSGGIAASLDVDGDSSATGTWQFDGY